MRLLLIFFLSVQLLSAQQLVDRCIFEVCYSEKKQQPLWLEYEVACNTKVYDRKGLDFKQDKSFKGVTSDENDYHKNVWDKGHLAPAAAFNCDYESLKATFSYLNCALQHEKLNRGPWKDLEAYERELSKTYKVNVRIELEFDSQSLLLETGALVPSFFRKIISYNNIQRVFRFPNNTSVYKRKWQNYEVYEPFKIIEGCKEYSF